ncbi:hypothetical protein TNCV_2587051 [Trichonephila clavipes]|nr:hypothetical protein TNCV_2587051 [Trichonephila clavipes]
MGWRLASRAICPEDSPKAAYGRQGPACRPLPSPLFFYRRLLQHSSYTCYKFNTHLVLLFSTITIKKNCKVQVEFVL